MIKRFPVAFIFISSLIAHSATVCPQSLESVDREIKGMVQHSLSFYSMAAGEEINYTIYLPPDYSTSPDGFPVLFLLHGLGGNENSWIEDFSVHRVTDSLIADGAIPSIIIVMPDGRRSYYINDVRNDFPYESVFIQEFIPFIDSMYRTKKGKPFRIIGGLSMGGFGTLIYCIRYPGYFSAAIALSAAVRTDSMIINEKADKYSQNFSPIFGDSIQQYKQLTHHWIENNPIYMVSRHPDSLRTISWYFDCGLSDYLLPGNEALHDLLITHKIPHEFHIRSGGHERAYWKAALVPALLFAGRVFIEK